MRFLFVEEDNVLDGSATQRVRGHSRFVCLNIPQKITFFF